MKITDSKFQSALCNKDVIEAKFKEVIANDEDILMLDGFESFCNLAKIHNHDTVNIGSETGYGKTALAINLINKLLKNYNVAYFNLSNSERDIYTRLIKSYNNEPKLTEENKEKYYEFLKRNDTSLFVLNENNLNIIIVMIQEIINALNKPLVVIVDTLHDIECDSNDSSYENTKTITSRLRQLTLKNNIIMFNMCHFNRHSVKSKSSTIDCDMHSFIDSSAIENDSTHVVIFGEKKGNDYLILKKNRYGKKDNATKTIIDYNRKTQSIKEYFEYLSEEEIAKMDRL